MLGKILKLLIGLQRLPSKQQSRKRSFTVTVSPDEAYRLASELSKLATQLKKTDLDAAIAKQKEALNLVRGRDGWYFAFKLAGYLRKAKRYDEAWALINSLAISVKPKDSDTYVSDLAELENERAKILAEEGKVEDWIYHEYLTEWLNLLTGALRGLLCIADVKNLSPDEDRFATKHLKKSKQKFDILAIESAMVNLIKEYLADFEFLNTSVKEMKDLRYKEIGLPMDQRTDPFDLNEAVFSNITLRKSYDKLLAIYMGSTLKECIAKAMGIKTMTHSNG